MASKKATTVKNNQISEQKRIAIARRAELEKNWAAYDERKQAENDKLKREQEISEKNNDSDFLVVLFIIGTAAVFLICLSVFGVIKTFLGLIPFAVIAGFFASDRKPNQHMICPHCKTKGQVYTEAVTVKKGIDGGKATAAVLTGGISVLATGLSGKENQTKARCGNCGSVWHF